MRTQSLRSGTAWRLTARRTIAALLSLGLASVANAAPSRALQSIDFASLDGDRVLLTLSLIHI